ncbi:MAG: hypothetical protein ACLS9T_00335 [Streptococcus salivarius]
MVSQSITVPTIHLKLAFELINGYLTADSWYRPASIIKDGVTWQASTAEDFRPLLMAWWPKCRYAS